MLVGQLFDQKWREHLKLDVLVRRKDFEHQEGRQDVVFADVFERLLEVLVSHTVLVFQVSEVGQRLDPEVGVLLLGVLLLVILRLGPSDARVAAPLVHLVGLVVMDVEGEQLLPQIETLAAVLDPLVILVDLK